MSQFSVSNVHLTGPDFGSMKALPPEMGIEIFYEWGGERFYNYALRSIMEGRSGKFSIHAPFQYIDFSAPCDERELFDYLMEPFELYHRFNAEGYVIHTDSPKKRPLGEAEAEERRRRVEDRLCRFDEICKKNGVVLLVENLCVGAAGHHLFSEAQYLKLLCDHPQLDCLIDVGHAHVQHFHMEEVLRTLGARIKGYHLHDNDSVWDSHLPVFAGSFDWEAFAADAMRYTPDAQMVLEYLGPEGVPGFARDAARLEALFERHRAGAK